MLAYRLFLTLIAPAVLVLLLLRVLRGRERWSDLAERFGGGARLSHPALWLHGASNGELTAARPLIEALLGAKPGQHILVTCNSVTARTMVAGWDLPRLTVRLAPLDYRPCLTRFAGRVRAAGFVVIENELWPNRLAWCHRRGVAVALIAARISSRSAQRWRRAARLLRPLLTPVVFAAPQDARTGARLIEFGLPADALGPVVSLKAAVTLPPPDPDTHAALAAHFVREDTVLAASTHDGEEEQVLAAFAAARTDRPGLRLILAPRHPARGDAVAAEIQRAGLSFARRSSGAAPGDAPVYLADTLGEMPLWYTLSGLCFVGGSLVEKGGHTPYEPAQFGAAILHGPHVENAADAYAALDAAGGAMRVADGDALAEALSTLRAAQQADLADRARGALGSGAVDALAATLIDRLFGS